MLVRLRSTLLPVHLAAIAVVLLLLLPWLDHGIFSADEGALLAQTEQLDRTGDWVVPNPAPEVDPELDALPLELAYRDTDGNWAPFQKNGLFVVATGAARSVAGDAGPLLLSMAATVAAAAAAALLARRLVPGTEAAAAWLTAIGSPLLFDSYLYMAHATAAATSAWAALAAAVALERRQRRVLPAVAAAALLVVGTLLRTEAVLYAIALGGAVVVASVLRRSAAPVDAAEARALVAAGAGPGRPDATVDVSPPVGLDGVATARFDGMALAAGVALAVAGVAGRVLTKLVDGRLWSGDPLAVVYAGSRTRAGGLEGRIDGFVNTWLRPATDSNPSALLLLPVVGVVLLAVAVLLGRRSDERATPLAVAGAALVAVRLLAGPAVVPGLLVAFPAIVGVLALDRNRHLRTTTGAVATVGAALFAAAVLATQYAEGGSGEWGGRYFAIGVPLAAVLAVAGLASVDRNVRRAVAAATVVMSIGAVAALHQAKDNAVSAVDRIEELRREVGGDDGPAPVLTTSGAIGRFAWADLDEGDWYTVARTDLAGYAERLTVDAPVLLYLANPAVELPLVEVVAPVEPVGGSQTFFVIQP